MTSWTHPITGWTLKLVERNEMTEAFYQRFFHMGLECLNDETEVEQAGTIARAAFESCIVEQPALLLEQVGDQPPAFVIWAALKLTSLVHAEIERRRAEIRREIADTKARILERIRELDNLSSGQTGQRPDNEKE